MEFQEELKQILLTIPSARLSHGGKEVNMRCRYCPDSMNPKSAHFYVNLGYDNTPLFFHCFKCHTSGLLTHDKLLSWGVYSANPDLYVKLINYNKEVLKFSKNRMFRDAPVYNIKNDFILKSKLSELKLKYINKRLGTKLTYDDLLKNKIVLNLKDLIIRNNIQQLTRKEYIVDQLDECFIGFISEDNAFLNLRNLRQGKVDKSIDNKYATYNLFNKFETTRNHYTLPVDIDLLKPQRTKIHIAEGPFDILSVRHNLRKDPNDIYSAIGGNGYINLCKHFILTIGLINIEFHIYIDNDVPDYKVYDIKNLCLDYNIPFYLHRNMYPGEKDMGTTKIKEQIQRMT